MPEIIIKRSKCVYVFLIYILCTYLYKIELKFINETLERIVQNILIIFTERKKYMDFKYLLGAKFLLCTK